jgi:hypothetical protein
MLRKRRWHRHTAFFHTQNLYQRQRGGHLHGNRLAAVFLLAMYEKHGLPLEKIIRNMSGCTSCGQAAPV